MYCYKSIRAILFTEEGQILLLKIRDNVHRLLKEAGAIRMQEAITGCSGDSWTMLACVDRLVELGELREITVPETPGQYRVFVAGRKLREENNKECISFMT